MTDQAGAAVEYVIVSRSRRSDCAGVHVLDRDSGAIAVFDTAAAARAYRDEVVPATPSKYLPLVVTTTRYAPLPTGAR